MSTQIIRFKNLPVLTTEQLAGFYKTNPDNIKQNFKRNHGRFVEGKHFYRVEKQDLRELKKSLGDSETLSPNARHLILWTERGAARHAKMLETDHAWEVFEQLEDSYFNQAQKTLTTNAPYEPNGNQVYLPKTEGRFFVENKKDGTLVIRDANKVAVIRRSSLDVVKKDCQTIRKELELFLKQIERMEQSLEIDEELLPLLGRLSWRGV